MNLITKRYTIEELEAFIANNILTHDDWWYMSVYQVLTESFIDKYKDKVKWDIISVMQVLSEEFIEKHNDRVNWYGISDNQKLSEQFIEKHKNIVEWYLIIKHQNLSYVFLDKHLYEYSLYIKDIDVCRNKEHVNKLQEKYKDKYQIDKLAYEINI